MLDTVFVGTTAAMLRDIIKETTSDVCSELRVILKCVKCKFNRRGK